MASDRFTKLARIARWAQNPRQVNHRIVRAFLALERDGSVSLADLREYCCRSMPVEKFNSNYANMKTDAGNSHGKVFFDDGATVSVWPVARAEIARHFR
jgi:hypothetical protein